MKAKLKYWLWGLAEHADWNNWPPRRFWSWLVSKLDREYGYEVLSYDYDKET